MATRRNTNPTVPRTFMLNISTDEFKNRVTQRIEIGEELHSRLIDNQVDYDKLEHDTNIWNDYNFEMLKQVFNYPDNDYKNSYDQAGYGVMGQRGEVQNNPVQTKKNLIGYKLSELKSLLAKADLIKSEKIIIGTSEVTKGQLSKTEVFIVHGHDDLAKVKAARFIEKLGLKPVILHEQTSSGKTIIEKIEEYSNVGFGLVLYTPCDKGCKNGDELKLLNRARQNVVFEHGYLIGKIGRENVCALVKDAIEVPNDISGVVYVKMDADESWHLKVARELRSSGYEIDLNKL